MAQNGTGSRTLWWWPYFISFAGIVAMFASHYLQLSDAAWPIIALAISAGLAGAADSVFKRWKGGNGNGA